MKKLDTLLIHQVAEQFTLEFIAHPYLCYTEHGMHARYYSMLYNALPVEERYFQLGNQRICVLQKEYPTATNLGKPQRQHWDIALIKTPIELGSDYDYLRLTGVVEFGLNEAKEHLLDDIERVCNNEANLDRAIIIHLYRLSPAGKLFSGRDWSAKSKRILSKEAVAALSIGKPVDIYYGMCDGSGEFESGGWLISAGQVSKLS